MIDLQAQSEQQNAEFVQNGVALRSRVVPYFDSSFEEKQRIIYIPSVYESNFDSFGVLDQIKLARCYFLCILVDLQILGDTDQFQQEFLSKATERGISLS